MAYKTVNLDDVKKQYEKYVETRHVDETILDDNYKKIRTFCLKKYKDIKEKTGQSNASKSIKHEIDLNFGIALFEYLNSLNDFTKKNESDYAFWRYLACFVIPDIIADRWNIDKSDHFYSKPTGIYPFQVYWYINLSWQGNVEATVNILKENQEDQILQLVDRPSSIGVNIDLYREIMKRLSSIDSMQRQKKFRLVMMNNTSKLINIRPELFPGGIKNYVDMIYSILE